VVLAVVIFFSETMKCDQVCIMSSFEVVVLQQLFILQVAELGLDGIQLVT
jgi:hypothetical protein